MKKGGLATLRKYGKKHFQTIARKTRTPDNSAECVIPKNEVEGWVLCLDCNGGETLYFTPKGLMELTSHYYQDDGHIWHKHPHTQSSHLCQIIF